jgi:hypothetical protein
MRFGLDWIVREIEHEKPKRWRWLVRLLGSSWWYVYQSYYVLVVFLQYPMVTSPGEDPSAMLGFLLLLRDAIPQEPQSGLHLQAFSPVASADRL